MPANEEVDDRRELAGPRVEFFCDMIRSLDRLYPGRMIGAGLDEMRKKLGEIEDLYQRLPARKEIACPASSSTSTPTGT